MEPLLNGIIDMHVHTMPDATKRNYTDFQLVDAANRIHARAVVIKCHHGSTAERAYLANLYNKEHYPDSQLTVFGGLVLNYEVGGLNPTAVEYVLSIGGKEIWFPTKDSKNDYTKRGKTGGITVLDANGNLVPEAIAIIKSIADHNAVLATGHLAFPETLAVVKKARELGVKNIVITHPEYWIVNLTLEQQKLLADSYGCVLEKVYIQPLIDNRWVDNMQKDLEAIKAIGYQHIAIATDTGFYKNDPWEIMLAKYIGFLRDNGIPEDQIRYMTRVNQAKLLGID